MNVDFLREQTRWQGDKVGKTWAGLSGSSWLGTSVATTALHESEAVAVTNVDIICQISFTAAMDATWKSAIDVDTGGSEGVCESGVEQAGARIRSSH